MTPIQTIEELLSVSHVSAIIARAGATSMVVPCDFGADIEVRRIGEDGGKRIDCGGVLDLQLKATINWSHHGDSLTYVMNADAYNRMIWRKEQIRAMPCLLVVCCLPIDQSKWLSICEDNLTLAHCCYYTTIEGAKTTNSSSISIKIPRTQLLTPENVTALIERAWEGAL